MTQAMSNLSQTMLAGSTQRSSETLGSDINAYKKALGKVPFFQRRHIRATSAAATASRRMRNEDLQPQILNDNGMQSGLGKSNQSSAKKQKVISSTQMAVCNSLANAAPSLRQLQKQTMQWQKESSKNEVGLQFQTLQPERPKTQLNQYEVNDMGTPALGDLVREQLETKSRKSLDKVDVPKLTASLQKRKRSALVMNQYTNSPTGLKSGASLYPTKQQSTSIKKESLKEKLQ